MGFPVPLQEWIGEPGSCATSCSTCSRRDARTQPRRWSTTREVLAELDGEQRFGRKVWGLLCLELWQQPFHDQARASKRFSRREGEGTGMKVLITGGAASSARTWPTGCSRAATRSLVIDNYATGRRDNLAEHRGLTVVEGTIADDVGRRRARSRASRPTVVVHAAASYKDPDDWAEDVRTNVARHGQRRHGRARPPASSGSSTSRPRSATACSPLEQPITLDHPIRPEDSSYAISKTAGEQYIELSGLDWVSFRLANAYGPRNITGPLPTFFQRLTTGKPCFVMDTRRDFIYVDDLVDVVMKAIDGKGRAGAYHVSSGLGLLDQGALRRHHQGAGHRSSTAEVEVRAARRGRRRSRSCSTRRSTERGLRLAHRARRSRRASRRAIEYYREYGIDETYTHLKSVEPANEPQPSERTVSGTRRPRRRRRRLRRQQPRPRAARRTTPREVARRRQPALGRARERPGRRARRARRGLDRRRRRARRLDDEFDYVFHLATYHGNQSSIAEPAGGPREQPDHDAQAVRAAQGLRRGCGKRRLLRLRLHGAPRRPTTTPRRRPRTGRFRSTSTVRTRSPRSSASSTRDYYHRGTACRPSGRASRTSTGPARSSAPAAGAARRRPSGATSRRRSSTARSRACRCTLENGGIATPRLHLRRATSSRA